MKPEQLLKISALAGRILLENGAEIQRTEDTICRICEAYGVEEASAFGHPDRDVPFLFCGRKDVFPHHAHTRQLAQSGAHQPGQ